VGQPQKYEEISTQILRLARQHRREGASFDVFWSTCVDAHPMATTATPRNGHGQVIWPRDTAVRQYEQAIVASCKAGWKRAYERWPVTGREQALQLLAAKGLLVPSVSAVVAAPTRKPPRPRPVHREAVLELLADAPDGLTRPEISERLDLPVYTARSALRRLRERGEAECLADGRQSRWRATG